VTRLYDDPSSFAQDALAGFLDANASYVSGVPGGAVRARVPRAGKPAVVVGGGSGHYPSFAGLVGTGLADGAVVGNIFTSPSSDAVYSVATAASVGGGVLLSSGNYTGDVMNFTQAAERLRDDGIDTRLVFVTDDVASAPVHEAGRRRGIAGDFVVFKVAGAAAEAGYVLHEVERAARLANDRTRTFGVAFAGCTLPGQDHPLFSIARHKMGVGLGIHGEPGVSEDDVPRAAELARLLVDKVLRELPADQDRVAAILNGLGSTKYEELFVLWRSVSSLLTRAGLKVIEPEVGELVTSLDMAGCSLTLVALDEELEALWRAPADAPGYKKGSLPVVGAGTPRRGQDRRVTELPGSSAAQSVPSVSRESQRAARTVLAALEAMAAALKGAEDELGRIDAVAGDGDHGRGMSSGVRGACAAVALVVDQGGGLRAALEAAGDAWASTAGGTSGALWGAALRAAGEHLDDEREVQAMAVTAEDVAEDAPDGKAVGAAPAAVAAFRAAIAAITRLGHAEVGDKTMLDALVPFVDAFESEVARGVEWVEAWRAAAAVATTTAQATAALRPLVGRARPLADRSLGTPDPGAVSLALCLGVVAEVLRRSVNGPSSR
jgi:dihydroxyacetone kinase